MQKPYLLILLFCLFTFFSFSQTDETLVKAGAKGLFIEHKVTAKESLYSIGRNYNVHPKHLAAFNGLNMSKGLNLGQSLNIPLSDSNFNRNSSEGTPLYYKSVSKQTIGGISAISKTSADHIRKWNNLENDIAPNSPVIIGYLISSGEKTDDAIADTTSMTAEVTTPGKNKSSMESNPKKDESGKANTLRNDVVKDEPKAIEKEETQKNEVADTVNNKGDGFFKNHFIHQVKTNPISGGGIFSSGIFNTTNGLAEGKYYALLDEVEPGTIIRVINPSNNKAIYAKVLGAMKGVRQNEGLNLRISQSGAFILDIKETDKFIVKVEY